MMLLLKDLLSYPLAALYFLLRVVVTLAFFGVIIALTVSFPLQVIAFVVVFFLLFGRR
jgi:hypothetical protein